MVFRRPWHDSGHAHGNPIRLLGIKLVRQRLLMNVLYPLHFLIAYVVAISGVASETRENWHRISVLNGLSCW